MPDSSLVRAARDPAVLGATLKLWPKQEELLATLDGPEVTHIWAIGRQASKSTLGAIAAVHNCALRPDLDALIPRGRIRYALVATPGEDQSRAFVQLCAAMVEASDFLRGMASIQRDRIDFALPSGAKTAIRALPCNSRSVRGYTASVVVMDEFAHFTDTEGPGSDERMLTALTPSTRVFGSKARVLLISTPYGETGTFYEMFQAAQNKTLPSSRVEHAPVWEIAPNVSQEWLENERARDEDRFRQEYGAEFVAGGGQFFDLRGVQFADHPPHPSELKHPVAGLDPAFHADHFGVAVVGECEGVLLAGALAGIDPGRRLRSFDLRRGREDKTLSEVWALLEPYAESGLRIVTDQHQADAVKSYFGRLGVPVKVLNLTGPVQTAAFTSTRARLIDGSLRLWRHQPLIEELRRVRVGGTTESVVLPHFAGCHCDIASALALATYELRGVTGMPEGKPLGGLSLFHRIEQAQRRRTEEGKSIIYARF